MHELYIFFSINSCFSVKKIVAFLVKLFTKTLIINISRKKKLFLSPWDIYSQFPKKKNQNFKVEFGGFCSPSNHCAGVD